MTPAPRASIARDLTILLLDPERGKYPSNQDPDILYSGALLLDLIGEGRIKLSGEGKRAEVVVVDSTSLGDPILDDELKVVNMGVGGRRLPTMMGRASMIVMVRALAAAGQVRVEETKRLGLVPATRYHPLPASGRDDLGVRLRQVLVGEQVPDRHFGLLAAMLRRDERRWVPKEHRSDASDRVHAFMRGDTITDDDRAVVRAMTDAVVANNESGRI